MTMNELGKAKESIGKWKDELEQMWGEFDSLEQYSRKNSLEIYEIPQDAYSKKRKKEKERNFI